jgi:hypothetical protein
MLTYGCFWEFAVQWLKVRVRIRAISNCISVTIDPLNLTLMMNLNLILEFDECSTALKRASTLVEKGIEDVRLKFCSGKS